MAGTLCLIGGGEHARVVAETARVLGWEIAGCWAPDVVAGLTRLGDDGSVDLQLPRWKNASFHLALAGSPGGDLRQRVATRWNARDVSWATLVHPSAVVSSSARIAAGSFIGPLALVHAGAELGPHALINSGALVEHDVRVGEGAQVAPGAVIGGGAQIGSWTFVGLRAVIRDHVVVGANAIIGMGAVVVDDIATNSTVVGSPARPLVRKQRSMP